MLKNLLKLEFKPGIRVTKKLEAARKQAEAVLNENFRNAERSRKIYDIVQDVADGKLTDAEAKDLIAIIMA